MKKFSVDGLDENESEGTWFISYGDMITLLLSFFVIFFSTESPQSRINGLTQYMAKELSLTGALNPRVSNPQDVTIQESDLSLKVHTVGANLVITFGKVSFFDSGKTSLTPEGEEVLKTFTRKYIPFSGNYHLAVKGFTDKRKVIKGKHRYEDNLELSVLRGLSVVRFIQKNGVPLSQMEIAGAGELESIKEVLPNESSLKIEEIESLSRTIVLVIKPFQKN